MDRRQVTFKEACARSCAIKLTECGGPTVSGLEGYICENCAAFLVTQIESGIGLSNQPCSYCGSQPTHKTIGQIFVCQACSMKALETAKRWYTRQ